VEGSGYFPGRQIWIWILDWEVENSSRSGTWRKSGDSWLGRGSGAPDGLGYVESAEELLTKTHCLPTKSEKLRFQSLRATGKVDKSRFLGKMSLRRARNGLETGLETGSKRARNGRFGGV